VTLVSGPVAIPAPTGVRLVPVVTAREMQAAVESALPVDIAVAAAAVADWRVEAGAQKLKKTADAPPPSLVLAENPDILAGLAAHALRPRLVVGFAAETENVVENAAEKRRRKGCDWIVANDVSPASGVLGGERNRIHLLTEAGIEDWPEMSKADVAARLVARIAAHFGRDSAPIPTSRLGTAPTPVPRTISAPAPASTPRNAEKRRPGALDVRPTR
jgi:phosphopantothenoylcysteine decarboxylase/phosphopantothenate--cysteine ligase